MTSITADNAAMHARVDDRYGQDIIEPAARGYLQCAGWLVTERLTEDGPEEYSGDRRHGPFTTAATDVALDDVVEFLDAASEEDVRHYLAVMSGRGHGPVGNAETLGHDLWLTMHGHGAGFWDRGIGSAGDRLSDEARMLSDRHAYVDRDGFVHIE